MNHDTYKLISGDPLVWTPHPYPHQDGVCPVSSDEHVKVRWADKTIEGRAGDILWRRYKEPSAEARKRTRMPCYIIQIEPVLDFMTCEPRFPEIAKLAVAEAAGRGNVLKFLGWLQAKNISLADQTHQDMERLANGYYGVDTDILGSERLEAPKITKEDARTPADTSFCYSPSRDCYVPTSSQLAEYAAIGFDGATFRVLGFSKTAHQLAKAFPKGVVVELERKEHREYKHRDIDEATFNEKTLQAAESPKFIVVRTLPGVTVHNLNCITKRAHVNTLGPFYDENEALENLKDSQGHPDCGNLLFISI